MRRRLGLLVAAMAGGVAIGAPQALAGRGAQDLTNTAPPGASASDLEIEPQVATVPGDPRRVAVAWNQQLADGGWEVVVALSTDGGTTWTQTVPAGLDDCAPPGGIASSDAGLPSLSYGRDRRLYLAALCYVPGTTLNNELAATLAPGATTWSKPTNLGSGTRGRIIADPDVAGSAFVAYLSGPADTAHSVLVSHTLDGGLSWLAPTTAYASQGDDAYTADIAITGHAAHAGPAELLVALHGGLDPNPSGTFTFAARSDDGGVQWKPAVRVPNDASDYADAWPTDPEPSSDPRDGAKPFGSSGAPIRAVATPDGTAYVVWSNLGTDGKTQLLISHASAGGAWSPTSTINATAARAFEPQVAVTANGSLVVTYYDDRHDQPGTDDSWTVDVWQAVSRDKGATWQESRLAGPMNIRPAVQQSAFTDYFGLAAAGDDVLTAYVATAGLDGAAGSNEGLTDVYVARTHP